MDASSGSVDPAGTAELSAFVREVRREREQVARTLEERRHEERAISEEAHAVPGDALDAARAEGEVSRLEGQAERLARRLDALDRAIERAAQGRLAICDACGGTIALDRLRARPGTELCVDCAREQEARR